MKHINKITPSFFFYLYSIGIDEASQETISIIQTLCECADYFIVFVLVLCTLYNPLHDIFIQYPFMCVLGNVQFPVNTLSLVKAYDHMYKRHYAV